MNNNIKLNKKFNIFIKVIFVFVIGYFVLFRNIGTGLLALINNDVELKKGSELTYYLNVSYDGSSGINSDYIYVEDKISEGLDFNGFVTTSDGSIGAFNEADNTSCLGNVVDDTPNSNGEWNSDNTEYTYHGLHYDAKSRVVSFKVDNLQEGCTLSVGIKTLPLSTIDNDNTTDRVDFYNFASAKEDSLTVNSNLTHAYIGDNDKTLYNVTYQYIGEIPANAPSLYIESYSEGNVVGVINDVDLEGYTFSGWSTLDVSVSDDKFTMPANNIVFTGSFTKIDETLVKKNKIKYVVNGEYPSVYEIPSEKEYKVGSKVKLDVLNKGAIIDGYVFNGWETDDVQVSTLRTFEMPSNDVVLTGSFSKVTYNLEYAFYDTVLPDNYEELLPDAKKYTEGEKVFLDNVKDEPDGYRFLGWYKDDSFLMPKGNVLVYGEWKKVLGTVNVEIEQELYSENKKYNEEEEVIFKVTIKNNESYDLTDVIVSKSLEDAVFSGDGVTSETKNYASISSIPANTSFDFYITYKVKTNDVKQITQNVNLLSVTAANGYELENREYGSSTTVNLVKQVVDTPITDKYVFPLALLALVIVLLGTGLVIYGIKKKK